MPPTLCAEIHPVSPEIQASDILQALGADPAKPTKRSVLRLVDQALQRATTEARPRLLLAVDTPLTIANAIGSRRLSRLFAPATAAAITISTAGTDWDDLCKNEPDPFFRYVLSAAGTALTRHTLDCAVATLRKRFPQLQTSRPMSPGNDGMPLRTQQALISLLPIERVGLSFDAENLTIAPAASLSAIFGIGDYPFTEGLACTRCPSPTCSIRLAPFDRSTRDNQLQSA